MVNPGAFCGSCREFLIQQIEGYIKAVEEGHAAEYIADMVQHYLKRFPITLTHNVKPSPEHLAHVNDNVPDPEILMPDEDSLTFVEYKKQMNKYQEDCKTLKYRAEFSKQCDMSTRDTGMDNPWTVILHRLTGVGLSKPCKPQAFNLWFKANTKEVNEAWQAKVDALKEANKLMKPSQHAASYQSFKSKMYHELPTSEKSAWEELAVEEHEVATKEYEEKLKVPISKDPKDLQECLECLPGILKPLIDVVGGVTGCVVFHGGKTLGSMKQTFIEAEWANFKRFILPIYGNFIKKCFTIEMCQERALPANTPTFESIGFTSEVDGVALHTIEGELFNTAGGSEEMPAATKASSKKKKPLREPPVKKTPDTLKKNTGLEGRRDNGNSVDKAPATKPAEATKEPELPTEPTMGSSVVPAVPPVPEPENPAAVMPESVILTGKAPPPTESQPTSPRSPASHVPPGDPDLGSAASPPVSPAMSRAGSPSMSRPPLPAVFRTKSVMPEEVVKLLSGKKRSADELEDHEELQRQKEKQPCEELGGSTDSSKKSTTLQGRAKQSQIGTRNTRGSRTKARGKTTPETSHPTSPGMNEPLKLQLPSTAPKWAVNAIKLFRREEVSVPLLRLVEKWIQFKCTRIAGTMVAVQSGVDPVKDFETKFWMWWAQLQPDFRPWDESGTILLIGEDGRPDTKSEGSWEALRMPGANGWVSIMATLCFWEWTLKGMKEEGHRGIAAAKYAREDPVKAEVRHDQLNAKLRVVKL
ncbi:hypothetical protein ARMGADRAFT_1144191 [Armillaria gallica]|uniref:Uncharacterized protein n=1 Tax=Armillaria gallica TaxID=47427 RepID=A0A2H3CSS6_ARMGA|nr:hypothetical protein ARMGADRAFT_1144191 [Armillaria gallica]